MPDATGKSSLRKTDNTYVQTSLEQIYGESSFGQSQLDYNKTSLEDIYTSGQLPEPEFAGFPNGEVVDFNLSIPKEESLGNKFEAITPDAEFEARRQAGKVEKFEPFKKQIFQKQPLKNFEINRIKAEKLKKLKELLAKKKKDAILKKLGKLKKKFIEDNPFPFSTNKFSLIGPLNNLEDIKSPALNKFSSLSNISGLSIPKQITNKLGPK
tara:strand:- start:46 stop:678 length:633 start_codon:yes stop_codon:yes gene_type:complete